MSNKENAYAMFANVIVLHRIPCHFIWSNNKYYYFNSPGCCDCRTNKKTVCTLMNINNMNMQNNWFTHAFKHVPNRTCNVIIDEMHYRNEFRVLSAKGFESATFATTRWRFIGNDCTSDPRMYHSRSSCSHNSNGSCGFIERINGQNNTLGLARAPSANNSNHAK